MLRTFLNPYLHCRLWSIGSLVLVLGFTTGKACGQDLDVARDYKENPPLQSLAPQPVEHSLMVDVLALAVRHDLTDLDSFRELLRRPSITLLHYQLGDEAGDSCIPESHGSCRRDHFFAIGLSRVAE